MTRRSDSETFAADPETLTEEDLNEIIARLRAIVARYRKARENADDAGALP